MKKMLVNVKLNADLGRKKTHETIFFTRNGENRENEISGYTSIF
jgi:TnpA family transposase